jgi:hypothetical protein
MRSLATGLEVETLGICDNAANTAKHRHATFEAKTGSGHVRVSFQREVLDV